MGQTSDIIFTNGATSTLLTKSGCGAVLTVFCLKLYKTKCSLHEGFSHICTLEKHFNFTSEKLQNLDPLGAMYQETISTLVDPGLQYL